MKTKLIFVLVILFTLIGCRHNFKEVVTFEKGIKFANSNSTQTMPYLGGTTTTTEWNNVLHKPTVFPPDIHTHPYKPLDWLPTWDDVLYKPYFNSVAFTGIYDDLSGKPVLFDGNYNSLSNRPALFDGSWNSLADKPILFDGKWGSLLEKPLTFPHDSVSWNELKHLPGLIPFNKGLRALKVSEIPELHTNEINTLIPDSPCIVFDIDLIKLKLWDGAVWKTLKFE